MSEFVIRTPSRGIRAGNLRMTGYLIPADRSAPDDMRPYTPDDMRVYRCMCCGNNIAMHWARIKLLATKLAKHAPTRHTSRTGLYEPEVDPWEFIHHMDLRCGIAHTIPANRTIGRCLGYDKDVTDGLADDKGKLWTYLPLTNPPKGHEPSPVLAAEKWCPTCEGTGLIDRDHPTDRQKIDMMETTLANLLTRLDGYTSPTDTDTDGVGPK